MADIVQPYVVEQGFTSRGGPARLENKDYLKLPAGTTAERPAVGEDGMVRFNKTLGAVEYWDPFKLAWSAVANEHAINALNDKILEAEDAAFINAMLF